MSQIREFYLRIIALLSQISNFCLRILTFNWEFRPFQNYVSKFCFSISSFLRAFHVFTNKLSTTKNYQSIQHAVLSDALTYELYRDTGIPSVQTEVTGGQYRQILRQWNVLAAKRQVRVELAFQKNIHDAIVAGLWRELYPVEVQPEISISIHFDLPYASAEQIFTIELTALDDYKTDYVSCTWKTEY